MICSWHPTTRGKSCTARFFGSRASEEISRLQISDWRAHGIVWTGASWPWLGEREASAEPRSVAGRGLLASKRREINPYATNILHCDAAIAKRADGPCPRGAAG